MLKTVNEVEQMQHHIDNDTFDLGLAESESMRR